MMCGRGQRMEKQAAGERDERWRERRKEKKKKKRGMKVTESWCFFPGVVFGSFVSRSWRVE